MIEKIVVVTYELARVGGKKQEVDLSYLQTLLFQRVQFRKKISLIVREVENIFNFEFKDLRLLAQRHYISHLLKNC